MATQTLHVRIISPQKILYEGDALSVSSKNSAGKFDILAEHVNFITLIENNPIIVHLPEKKVLNFNFPLSIIYTAKNAVNIYTYS